jgi:hypothetical protein
MVITITSSMVDTKAKPREKVNHLMDDLWLIILINMRRMIFAYFPGAPPPNGAQTPPWERLQPGGHGFLYALVMIIKRINKPWQWAPGCPSPLASTNHNKHFC